MTSLMALDGVTSFLRLKDVKNKRKRWRRTKYWREFSVQWRESWKKLKALNVFASFLCVRIVIDQLQCVNC